MIEDSIRIAASEKRVAVLERLSYVVRPAVSEPSIRAIQDAVSAYYNVPMIQFLGRIRDTGTVWPRMLAMYLCRQLTSGTSATITEPFNRDRSTLTNACQAIENRMVTEPHFAAEVRTWLEAFKPH